MLTHCEWSMMEPAYCLASTHTLTRLFNYAGIEKLCVYFSGLGGGSDYTEYVYDYVL